MGQGAGGRRLEIAGGRREEVAGLAGSIDINSLVLFLFSLFLFLLLHISYVKITSGMNSVGSLRKMFDSTAGCIK
jgi:hypothetical protein